MMYTMPKNLLSICVNFALATQLSCKNNKFMVSKLNTEGVKEHE